MLQVININNSQVEFVDKSKDPKVLVQQENADRDFFIMLAEGKAQEAVQELADLNFQLMINGVL